jgi:hypothetical protein
MALYLPHRYDILAPVEPLTRYLHPRHLDHWRRDTALWHDTGRADIPLPRPLERILLAMSTPARKMLLLWGKRAVVTWNTYIPATIAPPAWWSMRATSGTNEANRGSVGSALDMTILSATLGQVGKLGVNEAALCDGANTLYSTPNNAALAALTTWEYVFLVNPTNAGEGSLGSFWSWGNGGASQEIELTFNSALTSLGMRVYNTVPTAFLATTTTGLTAATWALIFAAYDNAGDRKGHLYKGITGAVSEYAYSAQPPMTGTYKTPTNPLNLFNRTAQTITFAGLGDEAMAINGNLVTATTRTQLTLLSGV